MRLFARALRRSGLPVKITEGFSPHPKLSIARALKLGLESDQEEASFSLTQPRTGDEIASALQKQLPEGIMIKKLWLKKF
jgi:radical SAM-linked protein